MAVIKKGTYKFNDTVSAIPYETLKLGAGGGSYDYVLENYGFNITPRPYMIESDGITLEVAVVRISIANSYGDIYDADNQPTSIWEACSVLISRFGEIAEWHDSVSKFYGQEFTIPKDTEVNELTHTWFYENTELVTTTTATPTADDIKAKIQTLIAKANTTTGNLDLDLTSGVNALIDGYGQGDPVPVWDEDFTLSDDAEEITGREPLLKEKTITANGEYPASADGADGYSKVIVNVAGGEGTLEYVIEVDSLPTDSAAIDKNALYKCGNSYYMWAPFKDIILAYLGLAGSLLDEISGALPYYELYYAKTRPTENIIVSGESIFAFYFIEDENNILLYGDFTQTGKNEWAPLTIYLNNHTLTVAGAITDITQATQSNALYALIDDSHWREYFIPQWHLQITQSDKNIDVLRCKTVTVDIPDAAICGIWQLNDEYSTGPTNRIDQDVNFTTIFEDGNEVECNNMCFTESVGDPFYIHYSFSEGNTTTNKTVWDCNEGWLYDSARTVDFGTEPQLVTSEFKDFMLANATRIDSEEDSPLPIEIGTEVEMTALLSTAEVGSIYKYTGTTGTYENGALYVVESVTLITFTINGTTYQATEGMTWGEWVDSEYNTIQAVDEKSDGIWSTLYEANITLNNMSVFWNDPIVANESYSCGQAVSE